MLNIVINLLDYNGELKSRNSFSITGGVDPIDIFNITAEDLNVDMEIDVTGATITKSDNIYIFPEDSVFDFKDKIYNMLGIPMFRQHIFVGNYPLSYNIIADSVIPINYLESKKETTDLLHGFPVDKFLYKNRNIIKINALDKFISMESLTNKIGLIFNLIDLKDITDRIPALNSSELELFYWGFIVKYWPQITPSILEKFVNGEDFSFVYPDLFGSKRDLQLESKILKNMYYDNLEKITKLDSTTDLLINEVTTSVNSNSIVKITDMFNFIKLDEIVLMKIYMFEKIRIVLTKIKDNYINLYSKMKGQISLNQFNSILMVIPYKNTFLIIRFKKGVYTVTSRWDINDEMNIDDILKIHINKINPFLEKINKLGRKVLMNTSIQLSRDSNISITNLNVQLIIKKMISESMFEDFYELLRQSEVAGIIYDLKSYPGNITFYYNKGIKNDPDLDFLNKFNIKNKYQYLIDKNIKEAWNTYLTNKEITITNRSTDVLISINDITETELNYFKTWVLSVFTEISSTFKKEPKKIKNILKLSKMKDPELYDLKKHGSNLNLSRVVQKPLQPIPYTEEEYESLPEEKQKQLVKFWNFTTNSDMYYHCPNKKYPFLNFIVNKHPKNYCIPCCKKDTKVKEGKKKIIYDTCMEQHIYSDDVIMSNRYIINYGKNIPISRISNLPPLLEKYITYNILSEDLIKDITVGPIVTREGKTYSVKKLWKHSKNNKVFSLNVEELQYLLEKKQWSYRIEGEPDYSPMEVIKNPNISPFHYNKITNAKMFPILIIKTKDKEFPYNIYDGLHRLSKAYILEHDKIDVKFLTNNQLSKSLMEGYVGGDNIKHPNYFLYGVKQNLGNSEYVGVVSSILDALEVTINQYINKIDEHENKNLFKLFTIFESNKDLINKIKDLFSGSGFSSIQDWNHIFIKLTKILYQKYVIVIKDEGSKSTDNILVESPIDVYDIDELIPESNKESSVIREYILLLQKPAPSKSDSEEYYYNPIYIIIPHKFYKKHIIEKKIYNQEDLILILLKSLTKPLIGQYEYSMTFDQITKWLKHINAKDIKLYLNLSKCYCISFKLKSNEYHFPILNSEVDMLNNIEFKIERNVLLRSQVKQTFKQVSELIKKYNKWSNNNIQINKQLIFSNKLIGIEYNNLRWYVVPTKPVKNISQYVFRYDPDIKSKLIYKNNVNSLIKKAPEIDKIVIEKNEYYEYVNRVMSKLDRERNTKVRKSLLNLIKKISLDDKTTVENLGTFLEDHPEDKDIITKYTNEYFSTRDREKYIEKITDTSYNFDKITLNKIKNNLDNVESILEKIETSKYTYLLAKDFTNPIKNKMLLAGIYNWSKKNIFVQEPGEKIFVKVK